MGLRAWGEDLMADGAWPGHDCPLMPNQLAHRRKPELSPHQKQMRFLTALGTVLCAAVFAAMLWLVNRPF